MGLCGEGGADAEYDSKRQNGHFDFFHTKLFLFFELTDIWLKRFLDWMTTPTIEIPTKKRFKKRCCVHVRRLMTPPQEHGTYGKKCARTIPV